ncbi:MAG: hypothetical protein AB7E05_04895 [Sphingobium sp.]
MTSLISHSLTLAPALAALAFAASLTPSAVGAKEKADNLVAVGEPISCISPIQLRSTRVIDNQTIDFEMSNGTIYRNRLPHNCPGLKSEERFSYKISTSQLCSVDIITVLQSFGPGLSQGASCGLGQFQKMQKQDKPAE